MTKFRLTKSNLAILIVLLLFLLTFFVYYKGAFSYPWLEDDDSYGHAKGIKYISIEKKASQPVPGKQYLTYIDPYPPSYDILFAMLHQTSPSINWTLKFFNVLIISLGIIFFYFFVKEFIGSRNKALFSTFVLAAIPCYLSHFIWAHSLIITIFFPAMYCLEMLKHDKKWKYLSMLVIASVLVTQPTQPIKLSIMIFIYFLVKCLYKKKFLWNIFSSYLGGFILSLSWWAFKAKDVLGLQVTHGGESGGYASFSIFGNIRGIIAKAFPPSSGSATRAYTFNDFFVAKTTNMINNPIGVGIVLCLLLFISLIYVIFKYKSLAEEKNSWIVISFFWVLFAFLGINSLTFNLPIGLYGFRFWMLFAIASSIFIIPGMWFLMRLGKKLNIGKTVTLIAIIIGVLITSFYPKYVVNTVPWGASPGLMRYPELVDGYVWLKTLPVNTKVFSISHAGKVIGFDAYSCEWCEDIIEFRKQAINKTSEEMHSWLKSKQYQYIILDASLTELYGINKTNEKINEVASSSLFQPAYSTKSAFVFRVV